MRGRAVSYSDDEMAWLEANRALIISDYHRAFVAQFGRDDVSATNLHGLRKRLGWKTGREKGRYFGRHRRFSMSEIAWLREHCTMPIGLYHRSFLAMFSREDVTAANLGALRKRQGWKTGRTGRFETGQSPLNKGQRCAPGRGGRHPNAVRTQFKKGARPHTYRGPGHERVDETDGYVIMIVDETNPWTGAATRPVHKHRWLWEQANGPIPEGFALKCLDGDRTNTDPSNWELVSRGVLARLNGGRHKKTVAFDEAPAELKPTILATAKLQDRLTIIKRRTAKEPR